MPKAKPTRHRFPFVCSVWFLHQLVELDGDMGHMPRPPILHTGTVHCLSTVLCTHSESESKTPLGLRKIYLHFGTVSINK